MSRQDVELRPMTHRDDQNGDADADADADAESLS